MELNHIIPTADNGSNEFDNCIPLCFDCHAEVGHYNVRHPRGRSFSSDELRSHRDRWYERVSRPSGLETTEVEAELREVDRKLFAKIRDCLDKSHLLKFVRNLDCESPFENRWFPVLDDFYNKFSHDPSLEFMDQDLEAARARIVIAAADFGTVLAMSTFPTETRDANALPSEWEIEQPERYYKAVDEILEKQRLLLEAYSEFIRLGRRRLAVD